MGLQYFWTNHQTNSGPIIQCFFTLNEIMGLEDMPVVFVQNFVSQANVGFRDIDYTLQGITWEGTPYTCFINMEWSQILQPP